MANPAEERGRNEGEPAEHGPGAPLPREGDHEGRDEEGRPEDPEGNGEGRPARQGPGEDVARVHDDADDARPPGSLLVPEERELDTGTLPPGDDIDVHGDEEGDGMEDGGVDGTGEGRGEGCQA
jgi:hypothetical protein